MEELLLLALLGLGGAPLLRWLQRALGGPDPVADDSEDSAVALLRRRYAAGEITREQYEEMRRTLARDDRGAGAEPAPGQPPWPL
ncbi:MAG TPA: SHOCT domain-containing protein [Thermomicrobiales bacterium]|nr:SHOCT domain-containing protein [Thermomicrobiales bacterium]